MASLYPALTSPSTEECDVPSQPLAFPPLSDIDFPFIKSLITYLINASFQPPQHLPLFISKPSLHKLLSTLRTNFSKEPNVLDVVVPHEGNVTVCGDLHGDLFSLLEVLDRVSFPTENSPLVFAGDLIDRGVWGVELCILVFALKLHSPTCVHIARGNHETSGCAERYGFKKEVERKYDPFTYSLFMRTFQELPVAVVVRTVSPISQPLPQPEKKGRRQRVIRRKREKANETALSDDAPLHMPWARTLKTGETRVLVVHGGLFRSFEPPLSSLTLGDLATLMKHNRRMEDPYKSPIEDVLWSDPMLEHRGVRNNSLRGAGILYGSGATQKFCRRNGLVGVLRAHEGPDMRERRAGMNDMCGGYSVDIEGGVGWVATVFTAANYPPDRPRGNLGAFATFHGKGVKTGQGMPEFSTFVKRQGLPDVHMLFYEPEQANGATPRSSVS